MVMYIIMKENDCQNFGNVFFPGNSGFDSVYNDEYQHIKVLNYYTMCIEVLA